MTELLRPGYLNISCTEDHRAFSGAVMSIELKFKLRKRRGSVFEKARMIFLTCL